MQRHQLRNAMHGCTNPQQKALLRRVELYELGEVELQIPEPTEAMPGSMEKIEVLEFRLHNGFILFHPDDRQTFNDHEIF